MITGMKRRITVTVDEGTYKALHLQSKNVSGYINDLLVEKVVGTHREKLVDSMTRTIVDRLMEDETFFEEVSRRVAAWGQRY